MRDHHGVFLHQRHHDARAHAGVLRTARCGGLKSVVVDAGGGLLQGFTCAGLAWDRVQVDLQALDSEPTLMPIGRVIRARVPVLFAGRQLQCPAHSRSGRRITVAWVRLTCAGPGERVEEAFEFRFCLATAALAGAVPLAPLSCRITGAFTQPTLWAARPARRCFPGSP